MDIPKIYVACLAAYNNGILHGQWIKVIQNIDEIYTTIHKMLADSPIKNAEEWAIHDYEGFGEVKLSVYESIEEVVRVAEFIKEYGELGIVLLDYYIMEDAEILLEYCYQGAYQEVLDFAHTIFEELYSNAIPDNLTYYIDYEAFARDLFLTDYFSVELDGNIHVFSNC